MIGSGASDLVVLRRTAPAVSDSEPPFRLFVDDACEFRLAAEQMAEIDDVERQQCTGLHRNDRRVARAAGQQRDFAKELSRPEPHRLWPAGGPRLRPTR